MKTAHDVVRGRIVDYDERTGEVIIRARYDDLHTMLKRKYMECDIRMIDSRRLSDKQRNTCYKLLREIANYTGSTLERAKKDLKQRFIEDELQAGPGFDFSLADCPMSMAAAFERFLVSFIVEWDVPVSFSLLEFIDDVGDYIYACLLAQKCCICGKPADLHHWDRVGMGRSRKKLEHEGMLAEPLCRLHHTECHTMPREDFDLRYKISPVAIDDRIKEIWGLNGCRGRHDRIEEWIEESEEEIENGAE